MIEKLESKDFNLGSLFNNDFYFVPDYQREYVWENDEVTSLLDDIYEALFENNNLSKENEYFTGSIIVTRRQNSNEFEIIDGQQRLTTFFLLFCVCRDLLKKFETNVSSLTKLICESKEDKAGIEEINTFRVTLQYTDSNNILEKIGNYEFNKIADLNKEYCSRSVSNIINAYTKIKKFIEQKPNFSKDFVGIFWKSIKDNVKLIRILTPNLDNALEIFERINARGKGLEPIDLVKNLVFMRVKEDDFEYIKQTWKKIDNSFKEKGEKLTRFLRYYILSNFDVDYSNPPREESTYKWFRDNELLCGLRNNPKLFVDELEKQSKIWINFLNSQDMQGNPNKFIRNIDLMSHQRIRQHFILLLSARNLNNKQFERLCQKIENLIFVYTIIKEPPKNWEKNFIKMSKLIRNIKDEESFNDFIKINFDEYIKSQVPNFEFEFKRINEDRLYGYQMNYILSKLYQRAECEAFGEYKDLQMFLPKGKDPTIEHILPETPPSHNSRFDLPEKREEYLGKIGNLAVLEGSINKSIGNCSFADKKTKGYCKSKYFLNNLICEEKNVGKETSINRASKDYYHRYSDDWSSKDIDKRTDILCKLALATWGLKNS